MRNLIIMLFVMTLVGIGHSQEKMLIAFELQDQFDQTYTQNSFDGKSIILLGADREGSEFTDKWVSSLADSLTARGQIESVQFAALATLAGAPETMKDMIKGFFPQEKENWVLLDWKGVFADAYKFAPAACNIVIFDKEKKLVAHKAVTDFDQATVNELLDAIAPK